MFILTKRRKFLLSSLVLSIGLFLLTIIGFEYKYQAIVVLSLMAGIFTFWSLRGSASKLAVWLTLILPVFFTAGVSLFYFLLPVSLLTVAPVVIVYFVGMYALLLTENIFSVAAIRTINLFRSASAVGFFLTLLIAFFLFNTIISFKMPGYFNFLAVLGVSFPLILNGFWSVNLQEKLGKELFWGSFLFSFLLSEIALALSFWPVTVTVGSLFLTSCVYAALGIGQAYLAERLFTKTITEYTAVWVAVFLTMLLYTSWG